VIHVTFVGCMTGSKNFLPSEPIFSPQDFSQRCRLIWVSPQLPARALARLRKQRDRTGNVGGAEKIVFDLVVLERNGEIAVDGDCGCRRAAQPEDSAIARVGEYKARNQYYNDPYQPTLDQVSAFLSSSSPNLCALCGCVRGDFFLRKKPLIILPSVYSNWRTAITDGLPL
jgi:hypothetical protein